MRNLSIKKKEYHWDYIGTCMKLSHLKHLIKNFQKLKGVKYLLVDKVSSTKLIYEGESFSSDIVNILDIKKSRKNYLPRFFIRYCFIIT